MKNIIFIILFLGINLNSKGQAIQRIELKHNGFYSSIDSTKSYVVIEVPKLKQTEIYKKTLTYLNSIYKNPASVISTVEGESITINGMTEAIKGDLNWYRYPFSYNIVIQFKDGKLRFEPRYIKLLEYWAESKPPRTIYLSNTDSPNQVEINCIFMKNKDNPSYWLFKTDIKESIDKWANNYLQEISKNLADNW